MPQNQPFRHHAAMLADTSRHILGRTEGRGLAFGQLVRTHKGKCPKSRSSSDGHSDHNALCRQKIVVCRARSQPPDWVKVCLISTVVFLPVSIIPRVEKCLGLSVGDRILCLRSAPVSKLDQGEPGTNRCLSSSLHKTGSGEVS